MMQITLANLKEATEQQVFDQVAKHLLTQNKKSVVGTNCAYRGDDGLMCAAGCLLSDAEYAELKESNQIDVGSGKSWGFLADGAEVVPDQHSSLIQDLQIIHDNQHGPENWKLKLDQLAFEKDLDNSVLLAFA